MKGQLIRTAVIKVGVAKIGGNWHGETRVAEITTNIDDTINSVMDRIRDEDADVVFVSLLDAKEI